MPGKSYRQRRIVRYKEIVNGYALLASTYDKSRFPWENGPLGIIEREEISKVLGGQYLLECGVGTGRNAIAFGDNSFFVGCDISKDMVMYCKAKLASEKIDAELVLADAENLPFVNDVFDSIICSRTFKFFQEPLQFLTESIRVLRKDGRCMITLGSLDSFCYRLAVRLGLIKLSEEKYYSTSDIVHLSHRAAFSNITIRPVGNVFFGFYSFLWFNLYQTKIAHILRFLPQRFTRFFLRIGRKWFSSHILVCARA